MFSRLLSARIAEPFHPNERSLKKVINNMVQAPVDNSAKSTKREHLAFMIADAFNDLSQIKLYVTYCKKHPLTVIHRAFAEAKSYPEARIKKSRAAIFFYLLKTYAHQANENSGN
jgi:hypothetical protein